MSSTALVPVITRVGLAALVNAQASGLKAEVARVAVGLGALSGGVRVGYTPSKAATSLVAEAARVPILQSVRLDPAGFRIEAEIPPAADFAIREVGFFLATGELFAVWSDPAFPLAYVTALASCQLAMDLFLEQIPTSSLAITVQAAAIPDTSTVLAEMLAMHARTFIETSRTNRRLDAAGIKGV